jgi:hypothetical protein
VTAPIVPDIEFVSERMGCAPFFEFFCPEFRSAWTRKSRRADKRRGRDGKKSVMLKQRSIRYFGVQSPYYLQLTYLFVCAVLILSTVD